MKNRYWNPYLVGAGIGVLSWVVFVAVNAPIGITTALSQASGAAATPFLGSETVVENPYWAKNLPAWDYGTFFLIGTFAGALISALVSKTFRLETVPETWRQRFGESVPKRMAFAFLGGILTMYGARMAGGCTSGHGISGALQLAVSSWTFFLVMFASGVIAAQLLFRRGAQ